MAKEPQSIITTRTPLSVARIFNIVVGHEPTGIKTPGSDEAIMRMANTSRHPKFTRSN
ncbi:MAG: hypothetical protein KAS59_00935 [Alphaproteobacteria bacterium]|nr:hypothetical protein [Alphaproteobacteria bacterium]